MQVYYATQFVLPLPPGHRFPMAKYQLLRDRLAAELPGMQLVQAPPATDGELALVHCPAYIAAISDGSVDAKLMREIGFPWSEAMAERARRSVGATIAACRAAFMNGVAANIAGGTHHAYADRGGGYCVFNDAAVASRLMQAECARECGPHACRYAAALPPEGAQSPWGGPAATECGPHARGLSRSAAPRGGLRVLGRPSGAHARPLKVAIVDLDVHQGNGTARVFRDDASVFTLSLHGQKNFPFRKEASDLDVDLPDGCGDDDYLHALERALDELDQRFEPGLVIYLAGADPHEGDRLGRLKLTWDGLEARDRRVFDWAWQRRLPLAFAMAGGYGARIEDTVQAQVNTFKVAMEYAQRWQNVAR